MCQLWHLRRRLPHRCHRRGLMPSALGKTSRSPFGVASSFIVCCLLLMVSCGGAPGQGGELRSGDLLFVEDAGSALGEAISASTGSYTHVAMVWRDSALWVVEATAPEGVRRVEYGEWMAGQRGRVVAMAVMDAASSLQIRARSSAAGASGRSTSTCAPTAPCAWRTSTGPTGPPGASGAPRPASSCFEERI